MNFNQYIENGEYYFSLADAIIFLLFATSVLYLFLFALKSLKKKRNKYSEAEEYYRFAVLIPAYKEDGIILNTVESFMQQKYPKEQYDVIVISDQMKENTLQKLTELSAKVVKITREESSKAYALQQGMLYIEEKKLKYDVVVILDADNLVKEHYLHDLNNAFYSGCSAVQTHRVAKNKNTSVATLDAVSEEINNSIFRRGHTALGFSSSLIGSGMAFEYDIFSEYVHKLDSVGEDKQLELHLLRNYVYVEYLEKTYTYDEKVKKSSQFYRQRRRWVFSQFHNLFMGLPYLPKAIFSGNWDYCNKIFQWAMPPRIILLGCITIIALIMTSIQWNLAIKWWALLGLLGFTFALAIPDYLVNGKLIKALLKLPFLFILMFLNLFRMKGADKAFIHTEHDE